MIGIEKREISDQQYKVLISIGSGRAIGNTIKESYKLNILMTNDTIEEVCRRPY